MCSGTLTAYLPADTTSYSYTTRPDGDRVCFFVDTIDTSGNSSFKWARTAEAVAAAELDTTPSVPTPEGSPLRPEATPEEGDEGNRLTWSGLGAGDEGSTEPAQGFRIHRWNPATAAYEKEPRDLGRSVRVLRHRRGESRNAEGGGEVDDLSTPFVRGS